jgi:hypothetical protein
LADRPDELSLFVCGIFLVELEYTPVRCLVWGIFDLITSFRPKPGLGFGGRSRFQRVGPAVKKARSPKRLRVAGTWSKSSVVCEFPKHWKGQWLLSSSWRFVPEVQDEPHVRISTWGSLETLATGDIAPLRTSVADRFCSIRNHRRKWKH